MKTLVLGIGNQLLGDDGLGLYVAREVASRVKDANVEIKSTSVVGFSLLELILGYDRLIMVDAMMTENGEPGDIYKFTTRSLSNPAGFTATSHHVNLAGVVELGRKLFPDQMPAEIIILAAAIPEVRQITEEMTTRVKQAVPKMVDMVLEEIGSKLLRVA